MPTTKWIQMDPNGGFILFHVFLLNGASRGMAFNDLPKKNHLRFVNKGFTPQFMAISGNTMMKQ
jgi:hypothetical protein